MSIFFNKKPSFKLQSILYFIAAAFTLLGFLQPSNLYAKDKKPPRSHYVIVSIAPYQSFVEAIAGDSAKVATVVPPAASFHSFEPNPKEIIKNSQADIWFRVGESFETRMMQALQAYRPAMKIVDLRSNVNLIVVNPGEATCPCHQGGEDLHMWLSPRVAKVQVTTIANALSEMYPENKEQYQERLNLVLNSLDALDSQLTQILQPLKNRTFMVSHPAYAYFARDYHLNQLPIEFEGKDPSPRQLTELLYRAKANKINTIFTQNQYSTKGANLIAKELHAKVVTLDPYSSDYFVMMHEIARQIAASQK